MDVDGDRWNSDLYDGKHEFVYRYGEDLLGLLAPAPNERILDIGCGTGHLSAAIAEAGATVVGIDRSRDMLERGRERHADLALVHADARAFHAAEPFDAVFSNAALHWISDQRAVADTVWDALRPGGRFVAEFGGHGNVATIADAIESALDGAGYPVRDPWYFPTIGEHATLLEDRGFRVTDARLFDRPTKLDDGRAGLRNWLDMFADHQLEPVAPADRPGIVAAIEESLEPALFDGDAWIADYVRLRIVARRPE